MGVARRRNDPPGEKKMLQVAAVLAVGTYLFIRFTQHRGKPPVTGEPLPRP